MFGFLTTSFIVCILFVPLISLCHTNDAIKSNILYFEWQKSPLNSCSIAIHNQNIYSQWHK